MKCTSPCVPACEHEATTELLSMAGAHLGFNCDAHIAALRTRQVGNLAQEYRVKPLETAASDAIT